jgi:hypothetical protein
LTTTIVELILREGLEIEDQTNSIVVNKEKNCPSSAVLLIKSAVYSLFKLYFDFDVGNLPLIQMWIKSWKNTNIVKRERFIQT